MKKNFLTQSFFAFIYGVPLIMLLSFFINLRNGTNFKKFYTNTPVYKFFQGGVNYFNLVVLKKRVLGNVHFGSDEKLFYLPKTDGNVWADLYGSEAIGKDFNILWQQYFAKLASHPGYFFIAVPNKERVLSSYLQLYIKPNFKEGERRFDKLPRSKQVLLAEHLLTTEDYFISDTHWNFLGARKALREIFLRANLNVRPLDSLIQKTIEREGDITRMINSPFFKFYPEKNKEITLVLPLSIRHETIESSSEERFINTNAPLKIKVLVIGDSFRESLASVLSGVVSETHSLKYDKRERLEELYLSDFDFIIDVRVERYLSNVTNFNLKI